MPPPKRSLRMPPPPPSLLSLAGASPSWPEMSPMAWAKALPLAAPLPNLQACEGFRQVILVVDSALGHHQVLGNGTLYATCKPSADSAAM